jgi:hypothetical protein
MEELFRSGSIDQNRSSINWPLAKALQRHGDAETGFKHMKKKMKNNNYGI